MEGVPDTPSSWATGAALDCRLPTKGKPVNDRVRHVSKPAEPYAPVGAYGRITRTRDEGPLRITPARRDIPAMAHVQWGDDKDSFCTWERLSDLIRVGKK